MDNENEEQTPSGSPIYRHENGKPFQPSGDNPHQEEIEKHIDAHFGPAENVFHELVSHLVHIDVYFVKPTEERNYNILVTSGMSYLPMKTPEGAEHLRYAELMICLPPDWPLDEESLSAEENYWPIRALKFLARLPHEYNTWLSWGHTIPNGNPAEPFTGETQLSGMIIGFPSLFSDNAITLKINDEKTIHFFAIYPLYEEEMNFKLEVGADPLFERMDEYGINEVLNIHRPSVCADD